MKGISPFLASILLIAFVVTVAGIYRVWIINFSRTATETIGEKSEKKIICSYGEIFCEDFTFNTTSGNLTGKIKNTGLIPLGEISLEIFYTNATKEEKFLNMSLDSGEEKPFNVKLGCNSTNCNYERIRTITNCSNVEKIVYANEIAQVS